jgi:adenine-specific DNA-methyltransferase
VVDRLKILSAAGITTRKQGISKGIMARIDDLIAEIGDERVRRAVAAEVKKLREEKKFGLVFENHIPELSYLHTASVKAGAYVVKRGTKGAEVYRVVAIEGGEAQIMRDVEGASETERVAVSELTVVKRYGEAIYPALLSVDSVEKNPAKPYHTIINSDNYHALQLLLYCYEGKIDLIYLDPPYNSGARDWKYNNDYVDRTDAWRHSKWLSMMKKRLLLAKRLLKSDGVIAITIDENEVHHLGVLLEEIFPEYLRQMVSVVINPKGTGKLNFARMDEYINFCVPNVGHSLISGARLLQGRVKGIENALDANEEDDNENDEERDNEDISQEELEFGGIDNIEAAEEWDRPFPSEESDLWELRHARRRGNESSYRHQRKNQFYPIFIDEKAKKVVRAGESLLPLEAQPSFKRVDGLVPIWPIDDENNHRCWRFIPDTMNQLIAEKRVVLGRYNAKRNTWTLNIWERKPLEKKVKTVWWNSVHDAGTHGTTLLHKILGKRDAFPFPKSIYAVRDTIATACANRPNALILDFFAGSGTTLHATNLLNLEDNGKRRCILVTNNEVTEKQAKQLNRAGLFGGEDEFEKHGVCESVTWPRCKYVINGQRDDGTPLPGKYLDGRELAKGFDENLAYFKLDFLDPNEVALGTKFENVLPILWLMAGAQGKLVIRNGKKPFYIPDASLFAVLLKERHFSEFRAALNERPDITHVFIVTDSPEAFREMSADIGGERETFMLYKNYLDNFRLNTERWNA